MIILSVRTVKFDCVINMLQSGDCTMQSTTSGSRAGYPESENPDPISQTPDFRIERRSDGGPKASPAAIPGIP